MAPDEAPTVAELLGELGAGWWRADLRTGVVDSSSNVAGLLGIDTDPPTLADILIHRPWPSGSWRQLETRYGSGALRTNLMAVRDEHGELTAVFGLETLAPVLAGHPGDDPPAVDADAQLLHDILELQPAMVCRYLADGRVVWCNHAYASHFLRTPAEMVGLSWVDLGVELGHDSREGLERTLAAIHEHTTAEPHAMFAPLVGSGTTRWFQWTNRRLPVGDGGAALFQSIGIEVTELRAARDALAAMAQELARGRVTERRELARRLHDDAIQVLVSAMWAVAPSDGHDVPADDAARGVGLIREAIDHLRSCLGELTSPPVLPGLLIDHIADDVAAARDADLDVHLDVDDVPAEEVRTVAARVIAEGLRNVVRHANATRVDVALHVRDGRVFGRVVDDGVGADLDDVSRALGSGHVGLLMSRALVESVGGSLALSRHRPHGTALEFTVPLAPD